MSSPTRWPSPSSRLSPSDPRIKTIILTGPGYLQPDLCASVGLYTPQSSSSTRDTHRVAPVIHRCAKPCHRSAERVCGEEPAPGGHLLRLLESKVFTTYSGGVAGRGLRATRRSGNPRLEGTIEMMGLGYMLSGRNLRERRTRRRYQGEVREIVPFTNRPGEPC